MVAIAMNVILPSLFSLVFVAIGAAIISYGFKMAGIAKQSLSWPSIDGEIAHSAVLYQRNTTTSSGTAATYKADIGYRYKVNGANYSSSRISFLDIGTNTTGYAQNIVQRYPDKSKVRVYYDPSNPSQAILEPGAASGINVLLGIGGIFAAGGCLFLIISLTGHVHV